MLSELQSIARVVTPYALDIYDRSAANALLPQLAATIPNPTKAKSVTLEWTTIFTQLHKWVSERVVQKSFATPITIVRREIRDHRRRRPQRHRARHRPRDRPTEVRRHRRGLRRGQGHARGESPPQQPARLRRPKLLRYRSRAPGRPSLLERRFRRSPDPRQARRPRSPLGAEQCTASPHVHPPLGRRPRLRRPGPAKPDRDHPIHGRLPGLRAPPHRAQLRCRSEHLAQRLQPLARTTTLSPAPRTRSTRSCPSRPVPGPSSGCPRANREASSSTPRNRFPTP